MHCQGKRQYQRLAIPENLNTSGLYFKSLNEEVGNKEKWVCQEERDNFHFIVNTSGGRKGGIKQ